MSDVKLREALKDLLDWAEGAELEIEYEWGCGRSLAELENDGDLSPHIIAAREALAQTADAE